MRQSNERGNHETICSWHCCIGLGCDVGSSGDLVAYWHRLKDNINESKAVDVSSDLSSAEAIYDLNDATADSAPK